MGRMIVVEGDATTSGGRVISGSAMTNVEGRPVARVGDKATCPKHAGVFSIVSGDDSWIVDGQPVARDGDALECGCRLAAGKQQRVHIAARGEPQTTTADPAAKRPLMDSVSAGHDGTVICEECMRDGAAMAVAFLER